MDSGSTQVFHLQDLPLQPRRGWVKRYGPGVEAVTSPAPLALEGRPSCKGGWEGSLAGKAATPLVRYPLPGPTHRLPQTLSQHHLLCWGLQATPSPNPCQAPGVQSASSFPCWSKAADSRWINSFFPIPTSTHNNFLFSEFFPGSLGLASSGCAESPNAFTPGQNGSQPMP